MKGAFVKVTYSSTYYGGDYSYTGNEPTVLVPAEGDIEEGFKALTNLDAVHILHYTEDELYNKHGDELEGDIITNEAEVLKMLGVESVERAKRNVYKYTDCGAWIEFEEGGIKIGSIVEGCDTGTIIYNLEYPFSNELYDKCMEAIEEEADQLWEWANSEDCDESAQPCFYGGELGAYQDGVSC
jgi:hypothetical protein